MNRYECCACGRPVRMVMVNGEWEVGRCPQHPDAKRRSQSYVAKLFAAMRAAVEAAPELSHWRVAR